MMYTMRQMAQYEQLRARFFNLKSRYYVGTDTGIESEEATPTLYREMVRAGCECNRFLAENAASMFPARSLSYDPIKENRVDW